MKFFNRNTTEIQSGADKAFARMLDNLAQSEHEVRAEAKNVIIKSGVVDLYPDGPDKVAAIQAAENARQNLLCAIASMDTLKADVRRYYNSHEAEFIEYAHRRQTFERFDSHKAVEQAYEMFFKKS